MEDIKALRDRAKYFNVLYVEDQEDINFFTTSILKNFFKSVHNLTNGKEGLNAFEKGKYDIVISDIQMPIMTGLEMIKEIKKIDPDIISVVTTAFSDEKFFMESIALGVDKYVIKPIEPNTLIKTLSEVTKRLILQRKAKVYKQKLIKNKMEKIRQNTIESIANSFPVGCLVIRDSKVEFANNSFKNMLEESLFNAILSEESDINSIFIKKNEYLTDFKSIKKDSKNLVLINDGLRDRIFRVDMNEVMLENRDSITKIYSFSDITILEYQKNKIKHTNDLLQDVLFTKFKNSIESEKSDIDDVEENKLILDENEKQVLRKSRSNKTNALEYLKDVEESILDEIYEFEDLELEWIDSIQNRNMEFNSLIKRATDILIKYSKTIRALFEFEDLAFAINSLTKLLEGIDTELTQRQQMKIKAMLLAIAEDLKLWRESVFIKKDAIDIHYLDSSLFSSCVQIELELTAHNDIDEDGDMLELF